MLSNTPVYRFLKKNMRVALKQHGDGLQHLEEMSTMHIKELLNKMESTGGVAFEPSSMISTTMGNLMTTLTYGFSDEDALKKLQEIEMNWFWMFCEPGPCTMLNLCPPLRFIVPSVKKLFKEFRDLTDAYLNAYKGFTDRRKKDFDEKNPNIYIDHFLNLLDKPVKVGPGMELLSILFEIYMFYKIEFYL